MATFLHTMYRVTDPGRSRAFYEALSGGVHAPPAHFLWSQCRCDRAKAQGREGSFADKRNIWSRRGAQLSPSVESATR
jgi:hypothetical protein